MNRREFVRLAGAGMPVGALAEAVVSAQVAAAPVKPAVAAPKARVKGGTQHRDSEEILRALAAFGVNNICGSLPSAKMDEAWSVEALSRHRDRVAAHGI